MLDLKKALAILDDMLSGKTLDTETLPVGESFCRTAAADAVSRLDLPPFDKSAMDGYAVMATDDERGEYRVLETVAAGEIPTKPLEPGTATKVMTGAPVPEGAGKVVIVEHTAESDGVVRVISSDASINICSKGEDVRAGDIVVCAGRGGGPVPPAPHAAWGVGEIDVYRRPRVSVIATGDEIVDSAADLAPGKIMNSNGPMLAGLCRACDLDLVRQAAVGDNPDETVRALRRALGESDLVVFAGGVSMGDKDYVVAAMREAGLSIHFERVAVKPGKPMTFATPTPGLAAPVKAVFGLPGNPVAVYVTFHLFVLRAAALLCGGGPGAREISLPLAAGYSRRGFERTEYVPARLEAGGTVRPLEYHGTAHIAALLDADGFVVIPEGTAAIAAGEKAAFFPTGFRRGPASKGI